MDDSQICQLPAQPRHHTISEAARHHIAHLRQVEPVHVAAYVEELQGRMAAPSVKLHLAGIRMLFDWLVVGQVLPTNPASAVRVPKHSVKKGKTPVLTAAEARDLLDSIVTDTLPGLRDRALIALMIYTFARVGAVLKMRTEDVFIQGHRTWVRLREKGGKRHEMPCHHKLKAYLQDYAAALPASPPPDPKAWLFPTALGPSGRLSNRPMSQADVYRMICRRRYRNPNRLPQLPRLRHHRIPPQRRQTRSRPANGQPRKLPHHWPLRPPL